MSRAAVWFTCFALCAAPGAAYGQSGNDAQARAVFEAGADHYRAGEFAAALASFERAYELSGRPQMLYNIGQCHDRLRNDREAISAFEAYLAQVPDASNRPTVRARVEILSQRIADASEGVADDDAGGTIVEEWWFWTLIGVVVVGALVGVVAAVTYEPGQLDPIAGDGGRVVTALSW